MASFVTNYSLYKAFAKNDRYEINIFMNVYRLIYRIISCFILFVSAILYFALRSLIMNAICNCVMENWFILYNSNCFKPYFIVYKRTLFRADQKDYICIKVNTVCKTVSKI